MSDDQTTVIDGSITADADFEDVAAIRQAIRDRGFAVDIDFSDGSITVQRGPDVEPGGKVRLSEEYQGLSSKEIIAKVRDEHSLDEGDSDEPADDSERSDTDDEPPADDTGADAEQASEDSSQSDDQQPEETDADSEQEDEDDEQELTKRERRIQRLKDGIEDGTAYTSDELAAIAYDKDADDVKPNERAYISGLRSNGHIDLDSMDDPNRNGTAKLYYRGEQPAIDEASEEREAGNDAESPEPSSSADDADADDDTEEVVCTICDEIVSKRGAGTHLRQAHDKSGQGVADEYTRPVDADTDIAATDESDTGKAKESPDSSTGSNDGRCDCPTDEDGEPIHVESCPEYVEQEVKQMTRDAIRDELRDSGIKETADAFGVDEAVVEEIHDDMDGDAWYDEPDGDTDESSDTDDSEELLDEFGPANIGKIAVKGTFRRYECNCGKEFAEEQAALDHSNDTGHTLGWTAYDQLPKDHEKSLAKVSGPSTMR